VRLDKFLKVSGLIPRRAVAKAACDGGRVRVDGQPAKASAEVRPGTRIGFDLGRGPREVEVLVVPAGDVAKAARLGLYRELTPPTDGDDGQRPS